MTERELMIECIPEITEMALEIKKMTPEQYLNLTHKFMWISYCFYAILKKKR